MEDVIADTKTDEKRLLYSSRIIVTFVNLIRSKYGYVNIPELLGYADMELYQVEDDGHWFTQEQVDRFYERLVKMTGNPNLAREAGRYAVSPESIGTMARYVLSFIGPARAFESITEFTSKYTRSATYKSKKLSRTEIELTVTQREGVAEKPYQCENRMGYFEAIVRGFNYRMPKIEHTECLFRGGNACRYRISWRESRADFWKKTRFFLFAVVALLLPLTSFFGPKGSFVFTAVASAFALLSVALACEYFGKKELGASIENLRSTTEKLFEDVNKNYSQVQTINEIGHIISKHIQIDALLPQVIEILSKRLDYDRGLILFASEDKRWLQFSAGYGYGPEMEESLRGTKFHLDRPESRGVLVLCYRDRRPFLVNNVEKIEDDLSRRSLEFVRKMGSKSFLCCPILYEDECLGVLAVDNIRSKRPLLENDINLMMGLAPEIGISVHNALLTKERELQFRSILRTLAASIDARDNLTSGHSERVTEFSMAICREMHLSQELTEVIRVASQLHDYGKIAIKDSILKKSGPLSAKEREEIKTHVIKTQEILEQINFNGIYQQVPFIAGAHHERVDGTGYPKGLKGDDIPLGARIIAVADFFEAITAKRHYRDPMSFPDAISELNKESGSHLDHEVVQAFLKSLLMKK